MPHVIGDKVVYCIDRKLVAVDLGAGKVLFTAKEGKKSRFFEAPDNSALFSIDEETVSAYSIK
jgi:hypothetical protein